MITSTSVKRSPLTFFALVFVLALPFWLLGALAGGLTKALREIRADLCDVDMTGMRYGFCEEPSCYGRGWGNERKD